MSLREPHPEVPHAPTLLSRLLPRPSLRPFVFSVFSQHSSISRLTSSIFFRPEPERMIVGLLIHTSLAAGSGVVQVVFIRGGIYR